ncbi:MAG: hypothetical protein M3186_15075 [Actinomycetota bacterium]|nr:hypothetical protein [Actinomycetota bacterium]
MFAELAPRAGAIGTTSVLSTVVAACGGGVVIPGHSSGLRSAAGIVRLAGDPFFATISAERFGLFNVGA